MTSLNTSNNAEMEYLTTPLKVVAHRTWNLGDRRLDVGWHERG